MQVCTVCGVEKSITDFYTSKGKPHRQCKLCEREKKRRTVQDRQAAGKQFFGKAIEDGVKVCPRCQQTKALDHFHVNRSNPTGRVTYCKTCMKAYVRARYDGLKDVKVDLPEEKRCNKCKEVQPQSAFHPHPFTRDGLSTWCRRCTAQYQERSRKSNPEKALWSQAKSRARSSGLPFDIEIEDIVIPDKCPALGIEWRSGGNDTVPSLDKIAPEKGYVKGNIVVVSMKANRLKNDATPEELRRLADFYGSL